MATGVGTKINIKKTEFEKLKSYAYMCEECMQDADKTMSDEVADEVAKCYRLFRRYISLYATAKHIYWQVITMYFCSLLRYLYTHAIHLLKEEDKIHEGDEFARHVIEGETAALPTNLANIMTESIVSYVNVRKIPLRFTCNERTVDALNKLTITRRKSLSRSIWDKAHELFCYSICPLSVHFKHILSFHDYHSATTIVHHDWDSTNALVDQSCIRPGRITYETPQNVDAVSHRRQFNMIMMLVLQNFIRSDFELFDCKLLIMGKCMLARPGDLIITPEKTNQQAKYPEYLIGFVTEDGKFMLDSIDNKDAIFNLFLNFAFCHKEKCSELIKYMAGKPSTYA